MDTMYKDFKFETFGDAYLVFQDIFYLGNSKNYVTYKDLIDIIEKRGFNYKVKKGDNFINPEPIKFPNAINEYGWIDGRDIRLTGLGEDLCVLYMPGVKLLNKEDKREK